MSKYLRILIGLLALSWLIVGCNPLQTQSRLTLFDEVFRLYSKHLRWGHYRQVTNLMTEEHALASLAKIPSLKERRISRVEATTEWVLNKEQDRASGTVEISYYLTDQGVIRQAIQRQSWVFKDDRWQLDTTLPDLP